MPDKLADAFIVVHGHFYQPPRENPWLEAIEREASAEPYHNWNERIADECYRPNGRSRIFNDAGLVTNIVNNYELLSFNFGPTLLSWLELEAPDIYRRVLEADRRSAVARGGHGNAIAQAYGHPILPLCNERDRLTQIRWGKRDFLYRFGRAPEAIWLPETAIDRATLEALIAEGLRFAILAPRQALRVRPLDEERWRDVSGSRVDPRMPYRCFSQLPGRKHIDIFFYDGPVSHAVSFERLLGSSRTFVDRLVGALDGRKGPQVVHTAVDGETFGHHQRHADRALAYALSAEAPRRGLRVTNYAEALELCPPTHEVELDFGPKGEGTAWSCAHGIGRWYRDCSCHAGAPPGWNQAWRTPLRAAVEFVREEAAAVFEELGGELLADVWAARDDYVELLLDRAPETRLGFLQRHGRGGAQSQSVRVLQLLELQRHSLLAQTSCGWFFNDISGLEAIQVLRYAGRAVQLLEELSGRIVEPRLREILGEARSNLPVQGTGADVYVKRARPAAMDARRLAAHHAITDLSMRHPVQYVRYGARVRRLYRRELPSGPLTVGIGRLQIEQLRSGELSDLIYALIHFGSHDFHCAVRSFANQQAFRAFTEEMERIFQRATVTELLRAIDAHFGESYFGLNDLLAEEREQVLEALFGHLHESFGQVYAQLYEMHRRTVGVLIDTGLKIPEEFRLAARYTLSRRLTAAVEAPGQSLEAERYAAARDLVLEARQRGYDVDKGPAEALLGQRLDTLVAALVAAPALERMKDVVHLLEIAAELELALPLDRAQDLVFDAVSGVEISDDDESAVLGELLDRLRMSSQILANGNARD